MLTDSCKVDNLCENGNCYEINGEKSCQCRAGYFGAKCEHRKLQTFYLLFYSIS